jgi:ribosomal protein S18 acetylase RimI-like enzyme
MNGRKRRRGVVASSDGTRIANESCALRGASADDAVEVARLHADSWRRHYRGAFSDIFLDGDLEADRLAAWTERLRSQDSTFTLLAEQGGSLVGFVHVELDADPVWGALVDNLHVTHDAQGRGIGTRLLVAAARGVAERRLASAMHLWVLEQNTRAQAFYLACGGQFEERAPVPPPGGDPRNLVGQPYGIRIVWGDSARLAERCGAARAAEPSGDV